MTLCAEDLLDRGQHGLKRQASPERHYGGAVSVRVEGLRGEKSDDLAHGTIHFRDRIRTLTAQPAAQHVIVR